VNQFYEVLLMSTAKKSVPNGQADAQLSPDGPACPFATKVWDVSRAFGPAANAAIELHSILEQASFDADEQAGGFTQADLRAVDASVLDDLAANLRDLIEQAELALEATEEARELRCGA